MTDHARYASRIFWSDEDEGFIAEAIDLPGCSAFGATQEEALAELDNAKLAWIEAARTAGNLIPAPSPAGPQPSGKLLVRMPRSLHARLVRSAQSEHVSLNQYVVSLLSWNEAQAGFARVTTTPWATTPVANLSNLTRVATNLSNLTPVVVQEGLRIYRFAGSDRITTAQAAGMNIVVTTGGKVAGLGL